MVTLRDFLHENFQRGTSTENALNVLFHVNFRTDENVNVQLVTPKQLKGTKGGYDVFSIGSPAWLRYYKNEWKNPEYQHCLIDCWVKRKPLNRFIQVTEARWKTLSRKTF